MNQSFDPYHKWLGIPPHEQPANLYRLLGVALFEPELDVICGAADQRMAHLHNFQTGIHAALSQQLLNEVSRARIRLLNPASKAAYDEELRDVIARNGAGASLTQPATLPPPVAPPIIPPRAINTMKMRRHMAACHPESSRCDVNDAARGAPPLIVSQFVARPVRRRAKGRRLQRQMFGIVAGGLLGLVMGYSILVNIRPEADFLELFGARSHSSLLVDRSAKRAPPKRQEKGPTKMALTRDERERVAKLDTPPIQPSLPQSADAPPRTEPPPSPTPLLQPKVDPLTRVPLAVSLPSVTDLTPTTLADFEGTNGLRIDSLELLSKLTDMAGQPLTAQADSSDGTMAQWAIGVLKEGKIATPFARLRCDKKAFQFRWETTAVSIPAASQLTNSIVRLSIGGQQRLMAMRKAVPLEPIRLDMNVKETTHPVLDGPLPRADSIWLEVVGLDRFPVKATFKGNKSKAPLRKDATSTVIVSLEKLNVADFPEIQIRLMPSATGGLDVNVIRRLHSRQSTFDLTHSTVEEGRSTTQKRLQANQSKIKKATGDLQSTQRLYAKVDATPAYGYWAIDSKYRRLAQLKAQIVDLTTQLQQLTNQKTLLENVLKGVSKVESLVAKLDSAKFEFRVFSQSDNLRLDLAITDGFSRKATKLVFDRRGRNASDEAQIFVVPKRREAVEMAED